MQTKQNTVLRLMFFATTSGPFTESALPYLNLLDVPTVNNVYRFHTLKFTHLWLLPNVFDNLFQCASSRHTYNTRDASKQPTWANKCFRIKQSISGAIFLIMRKTSLHFFFSVSKEIKRYLLSEPYSKVT